MAERIIVSIKAAAIAVNVDEKTVRRWLRNNQLPSARLSRRRWHFPYDELARVAGVTDAMAEIADIRRQLAELKARLDAQRHRQEQENEQLANEIAQLEAQVMVLETNLQQPQEKDDLQSVAGIARYLKRHGVVDEDVVFKWYQNKDDPPPRGDGKQILLFGQQKTIKAGKRAKGRVISQCVGHPACDCHQTNLPLPSAGTV